MGTFELDGGLSTWQDPDAIRDNECVDVRNVSFDRPGTVETRKGFLRGNATSLNSASKVLGVYEYGKEDGTKEIIVKTQGSSWGVFETVTVGTSNAISTGTTLTSTGLAALQGNQTYKPIFTTFQDKCWIADGTKNFVYDGTYLTQAGRDAPSGTPTLTAASTGGSLFNGTYGYKFAHYSSSLDIESTLTAAFTEVVSTSGSSGSVAVTIPAGFAAEKDAVWDEYRVYRTAVNGSTYFFNQDVTGNFTDTTADSALDTTAVTDTLNIKAPAARHVEEYLGRLFIISDTNPCSVYYSEAGEPDQWKSANRLRVGREDGDLALGFLRTHGRLYVLKEHSTWVLLGDTASNFEFQEMQGARGGISGRCATQYAGVGYVLNWETWSYRFMGGGVDPIGVKVQRWMRDNLDVSSAETQWVASYEPRSESVWFSVREDGQAENDLVMVYFTRTGAWSIYEIAVTAMGVVTDNNGELRLLFGDDKGFLNWAEDGTSDGGDSGLSHDAVDGGSSTTVVQTAGTLTTAGSGLDHLYCHVYFTSQKVYERRRITSNTDTAITVGSAFSYTPSTSDYFWVGGIRFYWKSKEFIEGNPFDKKRWRRIDLSFRPLSLDSNLSIFPLLYRVNIDGSAGTYAQTADITDTATYKGSYEVSASGDGNMRSGVRGQLELEMVKVESAFKLRAANLETEEIGHRRAAK